MEEKIHYLYSIVRSDNKEYIGVSIYPKLRLKAHMAGRGNIHLKNRTDLTQRVLACGTSDYIYRLEKALIYSINPELNIASGGQGGFCGKSKLGSDNHFAKLSEAHVIEIRNLAKDNPKVTYECLGEVFEVSRETIGDICRGRTWKHIEGPIVLCKKPKYDEGLIIKNYLEGSSVISLAKLYSVSRHTIYNILRRNNVAIIKINKSELIDAAKSLRKEGLKYKDISKILNIGISTAHRYCTA